MKKNPMGISRKIAVGILGFGIVLGGAWYAGYPGKIAEIKIPSIPKESCLEHNVDKHMKNYLKSLSRTMICDDLAVLERGLLRWR